MSVTVVRVWIGVIRIVMMSVKEEVQLCVMISILFLLDFANIIVMLYQWGRVRNVRIPARAAATVVTLMIAVRAAAATGTRAKSIGVIRFVGIIIFYCGSDRSLHS